METKPNAQRDFNQVNDRRASERERLTRQLEEKDQQRVAELKAQHDRDVLERRQLQGAQRAEEIQEQRKRLVQEHPQPVLRPDNHQPFQRSGSEIDRLAVQQVDERNRHEIADMAVKRDAAIDQLLQERGQSYDQFKTERAVVQQERDTIHQINEMTR